MAVKTNGVTADQVLEATHVDVTVWAKNGQKWTLLERMTKAEGVRAADALFDLLTITSRTSDFDVSLTYLPTRHTFEASDIHPDTCCKCGKVKAWRSHLT